jgi:hypothetical protein
MQYLQHLLTWQHQIRPDSVTSFLPRVVEQHTKMSSERVGAPNEIKGVGESQRLMFV